MLKNKKYFAADGTQLAVYFMEVMNITQGTDGSFSHKGTKNMDDAGKDSNIDPALAPFDGTISWKQTTSDMTGILFSSDKEVQTKKFGKQYVNILMWHDNNTADVFKGKKIAQGEHLYDEGTAGHATGNHIHYGVSLGKFTGGYPLIKNEFGNWELPGEVNPYDVLFVNDTVIKNGGGYDWQVYKEIATKPTAPNTTESTVKLTVDGVWNIATQKALQKAMGTTVDGIISGQIKTLTNQYILAAQWGKGGSNWVKKLQTELNITVDGYIGGETIKALQKAMGVKITGSILAKNDPCVIEMQKRLNTDTFKV